MTLGGCATVTTHTNLDLKITWFYEFIQVHQVLQAFQDVGSDLRLIFAIVKTVIFEFDVVQGQRLIKGFVEQKWSLLKQNVIGCQRKKTKCLQFGGYLIEGRHRLVFPYQRRGHVQCVLHCCWGTSFRRKDCLSERLVPKLQRLAKEAPLWP